MRFSTSLAAAWLAARVLGEKTPPVEPLGEVRTIPVCGICVLDPSIGIAVADVFR